MSMIGPVIMELQHEAGNTRRVLERIPEDRFDWQPHPKSMSFGRLASHVAEIPGCMIPTLDLDEFVMKMSDFKPVVAASRAELLALHDGCVAKAVESMQGRSDAHLLATWRMVMDGKTALELPRIGVIRGMILNHIVHHRGQLTVYLRLNDVPLPGLYGPSADEAS